MGLKDQIIESSLEISKLTKSIKQCSIGIDRLEERKTDLIRKRDAIITVLKEFLAQPLSVIELDDDI